MLVTVVFKLKFLVFIFFFITTNQKIHKILSKTKYTPNFESTHHNKKLKLKNFNLKIPALVE
jgi:hypothetical protein